MRRAITPLVVVLAVTACERATTVPTEPAVPTPARAAADVEPPARTAAAMLVGAWASDDGSAVERWVGVGEHLVGVGFTSGDDGKSTASFEVMLLHHVDGPLTFTAMPAGEAIVDFGVAVTEDELRLTNPAHDDPTDIVYRREDDRLAIALDGAGGSRHFELRARAPSPAPALEALDRAFAADSAVRGGAAWAERFDANGSFWSRGSSRLDGPEAIGASIDAMRANGHDLAWDPVASGLAPAGDMAFTTGHYRVLGRESGEVAGTGIFVTIWRRHGDQWRIAFDTGIPDPPPPATPTPSPS
jgi:hypothetical protein